MNGNMMDSRIYRFMMAVWDIIVMNLLLILCSIPVFTIGAAVTAVYDLSLKRLRQEEPASMVKGFFRSFRVNFKQATKAWLCCLVVLAVAGGDALAGDYFAELGLGPVLTGAGLLCVVLLLAVMVYLFPLIARFDNTLRQTVKNSIALAMAHLPQTLLMMLITATAPLIYMEVPLPAKLFPCFITLLIMLWFAGGIYLNSMLIRKIFQKHFHSEIPQEETEFNLIPEEPGTAFRRQLALEEERDRENNE